jgi:hypothetical protein
MAGMRARRNALSTKLTATGYTMSMFKPALKHLLREWAALIAVLALVLGPLALGVQRSLGTTDKIAIASGVKPLALCLPGMPDSDPSSGGGPDCDHCTSAQTFALAMLVDGTGTRGTRSNEVVPVTSTHIARSARAPPARGPPTA